jgi:hypothetical protein
VGFPLLLDPAEPPYGLSVAVAFLVGTIELISVLHDNAGWVNPVTTWISDINLNNVGQRVQMSADQFLVLVEEARSGRLDEVVGALAAG